MSFNIKKDLFAFVKLRENATVPRKKAENADYDLFPCLVGQEIFIQPFETKLIPSGIASVIHPDYALIIENRSSIGVKTNLYPMAQTIDSGYRGEWNIVMKNISNKTVVLTHNPEHWSYFAGDNPEFTIIDAKNAIAQAYLRKVILAEVTEPKTISIEEMANYPSERGANWAGSTNEK